MGIEKFVVSRDDSIYEAWPDLIQTESGKLICVFTEVNHHIDRNNSRLVISESTNRGRTWSKKKPLTEKTVAAEYYNCARISRINDGRLAIVCDKKNSEKNCKEIYLWYADSEGLKWDEPIILPFDAHVPDKLLQLKSGRMIIAGHQENKENNRLEEFLWYSDDNGKTWSDKVKVAAHPDYDLCEISILECEDNTLVGFLRENTCRGYDMFKVISYDGGETWSEVYNTPVCGGHRPTAGYLNDGETVMVTYRFVSLYMETVFAAMLKKEELTETKRDLQRVRIFPIDYDRNAASDLGYTGWTQFSDGEIYVVNYIMDDADKAQIRGYSFYPEDMLLPPSEESRKSDFNRWAKPREEFLKWYDKVMGNLAIGKRI